MQRAGPRDRFLEHVVVDVDREPQARNQGSCVLHVTRHRVERVTGIEPAFSAWEADVLPLNYTREVSSAG